MEVVDGSGFSNENNNDVDTLLSTVQNYMDSGKLDEAKEVCHEILKKTPLHSEPYNRLGLIAFFEEQYEIAREFIKTAIQIHDSIPDYHFNLCLCDFKLGDIISAESGLKKVLALNPDHIEANMQSGLLLSDQEQFEMAVPFFEKVLSLEPGHVEAQARLAMGKVCANSENIDLAYAEAKAALDLDPDNRTALQTIFALLVVQHKPEEALDYGEKLVKLEPKNDEYRKNLDIAYKQLVAQEEA